MLRTSCTRAPILLLLSVVSACGGETAPIADAGTDLPADTDASGGDVAVDGDGEGLDTTDDAPMDGSGDTGGDAQTDIGDRLGLGELCGVDPDCSSDFCFLFQSDTPGFCTVFCRDDASCPETFDCVFLANSGGDFARVCVPEDLCIDSDSDGYGLGPGCSGPDCDDTTDLLNPGRDELCDGIDNDCDEQIDENPVDANQVCFTGFPGVCSAGRLRCAGGTLDCVGDSAPGDEFCDALDNDCDGEIDNETSIDGLPCGTGLPGACALGASQCDDGAVVCAPTLGVGEQAELCDALDNDCDGEIDEDFDGIGGPCFAGVGVCRRAGVSACDPGDPAGEPICNAVAGDPLDAEACNYEDDDCDDEIDEDFVVGDQYVTDTACGNCFTDCTAIYDRANAFGVCALPSGVATCGMVCDAGFFDLNAVPDDGCEFELDGGAVYVSQTEPLALDAPGCGLGPAATGEGRYPCASITYGIARAEAEGRARVRVADGAYEETLTVVNGVSLLGGHRPLTWEFAPESSNTAVRGTGSAGDVRTISAIGISAPTRIEGFLVYGQNATAPGANSYAIYVRDGSSALQIRNNTVFAGAGATGVAGTNGTNGQGGTGGSAGASTRNASCSSVGSVMSAGGAAGERSCQDPATFRPDVGDTFTSVSGGVGGAALCPAQNRQEGAGGTGQNGGGAGGPGGWGHSSTTSGGCNPTSGQPETGTPGGNGSPANNGGSGGACTGGRGSIVAGEWRGGGGAQGGHGQHGRGGGGGGAGSGQQLNSGSSRDIAGSGGGGGSGGCAGEGGYGGGAGGGSFGIFVLWNTPPSSPAGVPVIEGNVIARNRGGAGGNGGLGGAGGDGGLGGPGGPLASYLGPIYCIFPGAVGGNGSRGGHGGGGGGGCGGSSFDIVAWGIAGQPQNYAAANTFALPAATATGGSGGPGGVSINTATGIGATGAVGRSGNVEIAN